MHRPATLPLTDQRRLLSLVEHRTNFDLNRCQLNVYETHQTAHDYKLRFNGFTMTSMLRGKKLMHIDGKQDFSYLPGESILVPTETLLRIDFPEASTVSPTQCTALVIDPGYVQEQVQYINERMPQHSLPSGWTLDLNSVVLKNNIELAQLSSKLTQVATSTDLFKDLHADLLLKELVLCILKLQNLRVLENGENATVNNSPFAAVLDYIRANITSAIKIEELCRQAGMSKSGFYKKFTETFGISPNQLIIKERIKLAKHYMVTVNLSIKEAGYASGFSDPNYFTRMFRKNEGITPGEFVKEQTC